LKIAPNLVRILLAFAWQYVLQQRLWNKFVFYDQQCLSNFECCCMQIEMLTKQKIYNGEEEQEDIL
jgi:hypothetical protein